MYFTRKYLRIFWNGGRHSAVLWLKRKNVMSSDI